MGATKSKNQAAAIKEAVAKSMLKVLKDGREVVSRDGTVMVDALAADWKCAMELASSLDAGDNIEGDLYDYIEKRSDENHLPVLKAG
jgi:hypothetical protein